MTLRLANRLRTAFWTIALLLPAAFLPASYQLYTWENFDAGTFPATMAFLHRSSSVNTRVVDFSTLADPAILQGVAKSECGRYGIAFQTDREENRFLCVVSSVSLNRKLLGVAGKALFQTDIYIRGKADVTQTVAVAAISAESVAKNPGRRDVWSLYRFGILQNNKTYFSFTNGTATPQIYLHQPLADVAATTEGWHRFQLVFEGQQKIYCFVDGRPTTFSPIIDSTFEVLYPAIVATSGPDRPMTAYVDNLSIQWTGEANAPMPESPWTPPLIDARAGSSTGLMWSVDPESAWADSQRTGKPILMLFYNPTSIASQLLNNDIFNRKETAETMHKFTLLRVDINQLRGGYLARQFKVSIVPTFVVLGKDGQPRSTITASQPDWAVIEPQLVEAAR